MTFPHMSEALPRWATVEEFAKTFDRRTDTIRRNLRTGRLPGVQIAGHWYVDLDAVAAMFPSRRPQNSAVAS